MFSRSMEHREIDDEGVAFARNNVLSNHLVGSGIWNFSKVKFWWKDMSLDLIFCDLASVELFYEVLLQGSHGVVLLQMGEDLFRTDGDLAINEVASKFILSCLSLERNMLFVELIRWWLTYASLVLAIVEYLSSLLVK